MINNIWLCISSGVVKQLESLIWKHLPKAFWPPALPWNLPTTCPGNLFGIFPKPLPNPIRTLASAKCVQFGKSLYVEKRLQPRCCKWPPSLPFRFFLGLLASRRCSGVLCSHRCECCLLAFLTECVSHVNSSTRCKLWRLLIAHRPLRNYQKNFGWMKHLARPRQPHVSLVLLAKQLHPVQDLSGCWFENKPLAPFHLHFIHPLSLPKSVCFVSCHFTR